MQAFLQSAFLQALSYSLIASIWQIALLWVACITLLKLFKFTSAQKFNIAFIAQLSGLILFVYTFFHAYNNPQEKIIAPAFAGDFLLRMNAAVIECMPYAAIIYLCVLLFKLSRLGFIYNHSKTVSRYALRKISADNRIFVQQMSQLLSLHRKVKIYLSERITCPLTIGFLKPVILIPIAAVNQLTTEQMEAVILHEMAHIKRADYFLFIVQSLADKIFFFNIFSIMLSAIIERERENACDDWVLQFRYNSVHYAEALFKLGRIKAFPALAMSLSGKKESLLLIRIKRLLHNTQNKSAYNFQSAFLGLFSLLIIGCLLTISSIKPPERKIITPANSIAGNQNKKPQDVINKDFQVKTFAAIKEKNKNSAERNELATNKASHSIEESINEDIKASANNILQNELALKQNYLVQAKLALDSLQLAMPKYRQAINEQVVVTPEVLQKAISYQNFKQLENMLAASGDSIKITETDSSKNSYQKQITIEAKDKNGNKHVYTVIAELYQ